VPETLSSFAERNTHIFIMFGIISTAQDLFLYVDYGDILGAKLTTVDSGDCIIQQKTQYKAERSQI
jgi:hypothetical protein